jgi:hypothetical protein
MHDRIKHARTAGATKPRASSLDQIRATKPEMSRFSWNRERVRSGVRALMRLSRDARGSTKKHWPSTIRPRLSVHYKEAEE